MKKTMIFLLIGVFLLNACSSAVMEEGTDIEAHDVWARPALKGGTSAIYLLMHNHSENADEIIGASTDIAETTEIHKSEMDANGVMQMTLQKSVPLPVDAEISFEPGGLHIMLTGLKQDLKVGDTVTVTLHFKSHADITLSAHVLDAANPSSSNMDMNMDTPAP